MKKILLTLLLTSVFSLCSMQEPAKKQKATTTNLEQEKKENEEIDFNFDSTFPPIALTMTDELTLKKQKTDFFPKSKYEYEKLSETLNLHSRCGDLQGIKDCLKAGADINSVYDNDTALLQAVCENKFEAVKLLIENKADLNFINNEYKTALILA